MAGSPFRKLPSSVLEHSSEVVREVSSSVVQEATSLASDIGASIMSELLGARPQENTRERSPESPAVPHGTFDLQERGTIWSLEEQRERQEIFQLTEAISQEVKIVLSQASHLQSTIKDIEKITITSSSVEQTGIYHIRFFEVILSMFRQIRDDISRSNLWLEAHMTKRKKRGFMGLVKEKGNSISQSQELTLARANP